MPPSYDKPRIISTIILGFFLIAGIVNTLLFFPIFWADIQQAAAESGSQSGGAVVAIVLAIGMVFVILAMIAQIVVNVICLPFAIVNKKSTYKAVRIISYVYDFLFGALILLAVIKIILTLSGV